MSKSELSLIQLQNDWKTMFQQTLPSAALSKSPSQKTWPVSLDHCFARIILDHTVGVDTPWTSKLKSPAYKNMTPEQLQASISLGQQILDGEADLVALDEQSLKVRGKPTKAGGGIKRKREEEEEEDEESARKATTVSKPSYVSSRPRQTDEDLTPYLKKIALSTKTPFQKRVLTCLCQVPRGQYTTYGTMAKHLSSSPRAVGNALRNNPFAPQVPCHRVLAGGGGLGGFKGSWGRNGKEGAHDGEKRALLREEGVKFDGRGMVVGRPWEGFK